MQLLPRKYTQNLSLAETFINLVIICGNVVEGIQEDREECTNEEKKCGKSIVFLSL